MMMVRLIAIALCGFLMYRERGNNLMSLHVTKHLNSYTIQNYIGVTQVIVHVLEEFIENDSWEYH